MGYTDEYISTNQEEETPFCRIEITIKRMEKKTYSYYKTNSRRILKLMKKYTDKEVFEETASTIFNPEKIEI